MFKKLLALVFIVVTLSACSSTQTFPENDKLNVVTTLFPQYDFTRQIANDKINLKLLLPPGAQSHSYELTPADIININNADLFIYTGDSMEPWVSDILNNLENTTVIDLSKNIKLSKMQDDEHSNEHAQIDGEHAHSDYDPHIWTSPLNAKIMALDIYNALANIDNINKNFYEQNTNSLINELGNIDTSIRDMLSKTDNRLLVFGGHNSMHYFAKEYGLEILTAYTSGMIDADPSVKTISDIIDTVKKYKIPVIYYEELIDPKVAKSISQDTGAEVLLLHTAHNVSKTDFENGLTYTDIMYNNIENLKVGLQ